MKNQLLVIILVSLTLTGCAGRRFVRLTNSDLSISQQTQSEIRERLGKPVAKSSEIRNGETINSLTYGFAGTSLKHMVGGAMPMKTQTYYFHDDLLVGHLFMSTKEEDRTDFDESLLEKIEEGKTTIEEAIDLLGAASGEYAYPLTSEKDDRQLVYYYYQQRTPFIKVKLLIKLLKLTYGTDHIISKIEFTKTDNS